MEPRAGAKGNAASQNTLRTQCRAGVSRALGHIRRAAHLRLRRHTPEVGAGCGKAARPVLCGGRIAICVPTAIRIQPLSPYLTSGHQGSGVGRGIGSFTICKLYSWEPSRMYMATSGRAQPKS
jgi:hypothetical protein